MTSKTTKKFDAEIAKVLNLVIHSLYTNKDIFIRELVSNASDACDKLRYEAQQNSALNADDLKISIKTDPKARTLTITDNGIGMNEADLIANLGTIAKSGTQGFMEALAKDQKPDVNLIGQFGVGFYSSFMVATKVTVKSRKAGDAKGYIWESEGEGEYTVAESDDAPERGTEITLVLREGEDKYLDKHKITHIVQTYSDHITIPIELTDEEDKTTRLNKGTALWARPKSEVTDEQYQEFYRSLAHQIDKPFMVLHNKAEGKIEYTNLLFIPSIKPFDLFHPDRIRRVKLYVKRVFIAEETVDVIPRYLRFIRGVVDSEDLPLNISRETLQANPTVDKIRKSITSKVFSELKKKAEKEPEEYAKFWNNFGAVIKEGLCEVQDTKDEILSICRFYSTNGESYTGIDDYITRMKPEQNEIYYLSGEKLEALKNSPQIEGFIKRGIEVLFFTDTVDDFWVSNAFDYKGKQFKSVTRADVPLENEEETEQQKEENKEAAPLIELFKQELGDKVKDVRISKKLESSPVCLGVSDGDMDIRMERFLRDQKQLPAGSAKILEINPHHGLIKSLAEKGETQEVRDTINLLYEQALILEGENLPDLKGFSERLNQFLAKALAA